MIASRTANRPKIGSTAKPEDGQPDERREPDDAAKEQLAADPLAEDLVDDPDDRPGVGSPRSGGSDAVQRRPAAAAGP